MVGSMLVENEKKKRPVPVIFPDTYITKKINDSYMELTTPMFTHNSSYHDKSESRTPVVIRSKPFRRRSNSFNVSNLSKSELDLTYYDATKNENYMNQSFDVQNLIDNGAYSDVYGVKSKIDSKLYAIKVVHLATKHYIMEKHHEVKILNLLSFHKNIIRFVAAWEELQYVFIQTELCVINFEQILELRKIDNMELTIFLLHSANGLEHIHSHNLVHMDVKCSNILLGYDGMYKISDFGLTCKYKEEDDSDINDGDSRYVAPEVFDNIISPAVDVFSLGMSLIESIYDIELPLYGELWHEIRKCGYHDSRCFKLYSEKLVYYAHKMISFNSNDRPQIKDILYAWKDENILDMKSTYTKYINVPNEEITQNAISSTPTPVQKNVTLFNKSEFIDNSNSDFVHPG